MCVQLVRALLHSKAKVTSKENLNTFEIKTIVSKRDVSPDTVYILTISPTSKLNNVI